MTRFGLVVAVAASLALAGGVTEQAQAGRVHPNGQIAFTRLRPDTDSTAIHAVNPDGSHERTVVPFGDAARWSPSGRELAVAGCAVEGSCASTVVDVDTGFSRELPLQSRFDEFGPTVWSPRGDRLAGEGVSDTNRSVNGIYSVRSSDGGGLRRITKPVDGDDIPGTYSPDGHRIVFVRDANAQQDGEPIALGLFVSNVSGHGVRRITPPGMLVNFEHGGSWSPKANQIVFDARPAEGDRFALWLVHSDGTGLHRLRVPLACGGALDDPSSVGCFAPSWSPDGRGIVFGTFVPATGARNLYAVRPDGTQLRQVTSGTSADDVPSWGRHRLAS